MSRALVSFGVGPHEELLEIALPGFERYADRHGYELVVADPLACDRPPSWWKVPILQELLEEHDDVLWLDSDVVIVDDQDDVAPPAWAWQGVVEHHTGCGHVPNLGVWYVRQPLKPVLERLWARDEYVDHGWWEQAAMLDELGYTFEPLPSVLRRPTSLFTRTAFLETGWNVHPEDVRKSTRPRFMHATMYADRAGVMREWADEGAAVAIGGLR